MGDKAKENLNIETGKSGTLNNVKKFEVGKSKLSDKEIQEATTQADELKKLEKSFETNKTTQGIEGDKTGKTVSQEDNWTLSPDEINAIKNLNRPEAEKGIAQSYNNIKRTIKESESENEKGIAGFLGKIMNKILS